MTAADTRLVDQQGNDPTYGDDFSVERTVTVIPVGDTLAQAWLTVKLDPDADADAAAVLQKSITTVLTAAGQITDTGAGDQTGAFHIEIANTDYANIIPGRVYQYDVQLKSSAGKIGTLERGTVVFRRDSTRSTA